MKGKTTIPGIHHITAITSSTPENVSFYEQVLGLRLVKQTVNFDDPFTYHLYYGDQEGTPGTILTFFPWQGIDRGLHGSGMITAVAFAIPDDSFEFWRERLERSDIKTVQQQRFDEKVIGFSDPHGLNLELVAAGKRSSNLRRGFGGLEPEHMISGFHSATSTVRTIEETSDMLVHQLGMRLHAQEESRFRFEMVSDTALAHFYDVMVDPDTGAGRQGSGTVHHIAFRTADENNQLAWRRALLEGGYRVTEVRDRKYFQSIYFHGPEGVLFEIATDTPGFSVDETRESLGRTLQLPHQYEPMRSEIETRLPPLRSSDFVHE